MRAITSFSTPSPRAADVAVVTCFRFFPLLKPLTFCVAFTDCTTAAGRSNSVDIGEGQGSPHARQRLEEAKALDREIAASEGVDGGGG